MGFYLRKIVNYNKWESVKNVICQLGRLDLLHMFNLRRMLFIKRMLQCINSIMFDLMYYYVNGPELHNIQCQYGTLLCWPGHTIRSVIFDSFKALCWV